MHGIRPKVGRQGGADIGWVGRLLEFAEKPSIANGKKHVALDITKKAMSIILAPTDLCHPLLRGRVEEKGLESSIHFSQIGHNLDSKFPTHFSTKIFILE